MPPSAPQFLPDEIVNTLFEHGYITHPRDITYFQKHATPRQIRRSFCLFVMGSRVEYHYRQWEVRRHPLKHQNLEWRIEIPANIPVSAIIAFIQSIEQNP